VLASLENVAAPWRSFRRRGPRVSAEKAASRNDGLAVGKKSVVVCLAKVAVCTTLPFTRAALGRLTWRRQE
jgi:hypothetical protein